MTRLTQLWLAGEALNPAVPWMVLPLVSWLVTWFVRRRWPYAWTRFASWGPVSKAASKAWQALPGTLVGTSVAAAATGLDPGDTALAALMSLLAPVGHELGRAITTWLHKRWAWFPVYYGGAWPAAGQSLPPSELQSSIPPDPAVPSGVDAPKRDPP